MINGTSLFYKKRRFQKNLSGALRSWWDSDRIEAIVDPVQHSAMALSVSLEVSSEYLFILQDDECEVVIW